MCVLHLDYTEKIIFVFIQMHNLIRPISIFIIIIKSLPNLFTNASVVLFLALQNLKELIIQMFLRERD